jgi:hypothetical protein
VSTIERPIPPLNTDERTTLEGWPNGGFELAEGATLRDALATWHAEIARTRERCADRALADIGRFMEQDVNLRWIYVHMIEEYARHNGHADLLRERIDGAAGV